MLLRKPAGEGATGAGGSPSFANPYVDVTGNPAVSATNPFPYAFPTAGQAVNFSGFPPYDLSGISPNYDVPYVYNFNLNVERQLPGNQVLTVGYVGSLGRHLVRAYEADKETLAGHADLVARCAQAPARSSTIRAPSATAVVSRPKSAPSRFAYRPGFGPGPS